jgi:hypothetical protein
MLNQVLPTYYVYVFFKENRLPKNRYIVPRFRRFSALVSGKLQGQWPAEKDAARFQDTPASAAVASNRGVKRRTTTPGIFGIFGSEFTLQRRIKSRKKVHKKRPLNVVGQLLPTRKKLLGYSQAMAERWRPFSNILQLREKTGVAWETPGQFSASLPGRKKSFYSPKGYRENRKRFLTKIVKTQVLIRPLPGGFVWAGDYLRFEQKQLPKFDPSTAKKKKTTSDSLPMPEGRNQIAGADNNDKFDASLYNDGSLPVFNLEDLNYNIAISGRA